MSINDHIEIVRVGLDPFGRNEITVFYRCRDIGDGKEIFYCWLESWRSDYPQPDPVEVAWQKKRKKAIELAKRRNEVVAGN